MHAWCRRRGGLQVQMLLMENVYCHTILQTYHSPQANIAERKTAERQAREYNIDFHRARRRRCDNPIHPLFRPLYTSMNTYMATWNIYPPHFKPTFRERQGENQTVHRRQPSSARSRSSTRLRRATQVLILSMTGPIMRTTYLKRGRARRSRSLCSARR